MRKLRETINGCIYSEKDMKDALGKMNVHLPSSLLAFYLENSGQNFQENKFLDYKVRGWFNVKAGRCDVEQVAMSLQDVVNHSRDFVPEQLIPFAYNDLNDYFLLSKTDEVFFLRNDMFYNEKDALVKIADSFEDFVNGLVVGDGLTN